MAAASKWQDWASFALGLWLALSPWLVGYSEHDAATANSAFAGLALALVSHFEASFDGEDMEWLILAVGVWLVAAPFLCGFMSVPVAAANSIAVGICVAALAGSALELDRQIARWWDKSVAGH
jgi:hypothetical protein